jgi:hypothetical protein
MKIKFNVNSGANIHSTKYEIFDLKDFLGYDTDEEALEEWNSFDEDYKYSLVEEWAWNNGLEIYYEEIN